MQQEISPAAWSSLSLAGSKHVSHALDLSISFSLCSTMTTNQHLVHSEHHRYQDLSTPTCTETSRHLRPFQILLLSLKFEEDSILWHISSLQSREMKSRPVRPMWEIHALPLNQTKPPLLPINAKNSHFQKSYLSRSYLFCMPAHGTHRRIVSPNIRTSYLSLRLRPLCPNLISVFLTSTHHTKRSSPLSQGKGIRELLNHGTALLYQKYRAGRREKVPKLCFLRFRRGTHGLRSRPHLLT